MFSTITAPKNTNITIAIAVFVSAAIFMGFAVVNEKNSSTPAAVGQEISESYFERVHSKARVDCKRAIEKLAAYDLRWTALSPFSHYNRYQRADGIVRLMGDEAEAQNGFGGWIRVNYACEFNPATNQVVNVSLHQGRRK